MSNWDQHSLQLAQLEQAVKIGNARGNKHWVKLILGQQLLPHRLGRMLREGLWGLLGF